MSLLNVRLNHDLERKVKALRKDGLVISTLVRDAISDAYARRQTKPPKDRAAFLDEIHRSYPANYPSVGKRYNLADRKQARAAILELMHAKKRGQ